MYIPTWILILIIVGLFYYFYAKKKSDKAKTENSTEGKADKNWLDSENWKEIALEHMAIFPRRTGRSRPTYEEMLELDEDEFKTWLFVKSGGENQEQTLKEMIEHETKTGSFAKTAKTDIPPQEQLVLNVFDKDKSAETIEVVRNLNKAVNEINEDEEKEYVDIVKQSIWAKATSDYFGLGEKNKTN